MIEIVDRIVSIQTPFNMIVLMFAFGMIFGIVASVARETRRYLVHRQELEFRRELVERGLDPTEIEKVMTATPKDAKTKSA
ncbi:hypothetical protein Mal64_25640 [Pseudobythopirellula maris]|uniref:Uncharacterized protein n=1 Tax=Pseudobythopirellula maris TaxID=2527991 RepID=A0A5C5ZNK0_9BACT|nr:hypothetical protein [Pseudobythopirellula maris]TWT89072.1 hypothetical protein Mal64_25640 [Pseudobythopirellula maris]